MHEYQINHGHYASSDLYGDGDPIKNCPILYSRIIFQLKKLLTIDFAFLANFWPLCLLVKFL